MNKRLPSLWPYGVRNALIATPIILLVLTVLVSVTRAITAWPTNTSERFVLIGIFILALVPVILLLIDGFAARGAVLEYAGIKLAFVQIAQAAPSSPTVPTNIGVAGRPVSDSGSTEILDTLRRAATNEVVVIDLEEGQAWWETRLLVLLSGAARLSTPRAVVFVATVGGQSGCYQGWGAPDALLKELLARTDPLIRHIYYQVKAAANQWALLDPPPLPGEPSHPPASSLSGLVSQHLWMAFEGDHPNPLAAEQLLASELSARVEQSSPVRTISIIRLEELFVSVLNTHCVDQNGPPEEQRKQFFADGAAYIAVTQDRKYLKLVPRISAISTMVAALAGEQNGFNLPSA